VTLSKPMRLSAMVKKTYSTPALNPPSEFVVLGVEKV
jgi:hypothetical protein